MGIDAIHEALLPLIPGYLMNAPGLIEGDPGDDARMIMKLTNNLYPLTGELLLGLIIKTVGSADLAPDQDAFPVAVIEESLILRLLMLSNPIISRFQNYLQIPDKGLLIRRVSGRNRPSIPDPESVSDKRGSC